MASKYWLKLFHETIYDPKVMMRSPGARLRWYECLCLAGDYDQEGALPSIEHMLFVFRIPEEQLLDELSELARIGLVTEVDGVYHVKNWVKRQASMDGAERIARFRETKHHEEYKGVVTNKDKTRNKVVTNRYTDIDIDIDKETDIEKNKNGGNGFEPTMPKLGDGIKRDHTEKWWA